MKHVKKLRKKLYALKQKEQVVFVPGIGKRKTPLQIKYKNDIRNIENMESDAESDSYTCKNNKKLIVDHIRHSKTKTGYRSEKTIYKCEDCIGCSYKKDCIKGNNCKTSLEERTKTLQIAKTFLKYREEDFERIRSEEGTLFRTNRSIQVEGSFGDIKQDIPAGQ